MNKLVISVFIFSLIFTYGCTNKNQWTKIDGSSYELDRDHNECKSYAANNSDVESPPPSYSTNCSGYADMSGGYGVGSINCTTSRNSPSKEVTAAKFVTKLSLIGIKYNKCMERKGWIKKASIEENLNRKQYDYKELKRKCPIKYDFVNNILTNHPKLAKEKQETNSVTSYFIYSDLNLQLNVVQKSLNIIIDGIDINFSTENDNAKKALLRMIDNAKKGIKTDGFNFDLIELHNTPLYGYYWRGSNHTKKLVSIGVTTIDNSCMYIYEIIGKQNDIEKYDLNKTERKLKVIFNYPDS